METNSLYKITYKSNDSADPTSKYIVGPDAITILTFLKNHLNFSSYIVIKLERVQETVIMVPHNL